MENSSLLVGKTVKFSKSSEVTLEGRVMDKITMRLKPDDSTTVTGYMIVTPDNKIHSNIAHWRLISIVEGELNSNQNN